MSNLQELAARVLALPDAQYFEFDAARQRELQARLSALVSSDDLPPRPGAPATAKVPAGTLVLGAPREAKLDALVPQVPVLVGSLRSGLRDWQVNFKPNLHLLVRQVDSGRLDVLTPEVSMRRGAGDLRSGAGQAPAPRQANTLVAAVTKVDLRERLGDGLGDGRYVVTAIAHDWRSNSVAVRVRGKAPARVPPTEEISPNAIQHAADPRAQMPTRLELPAQASATDPLRVRLALQVGAEDGMAQGGQPPVWRGHLVLLPLDGRAVVVPLRVPAQQAAGSNPARYNVVCQVDLRQAVPELEPGAYQVVVDTGAGVLGPQPLLLSE